MSHRVSFTRVCTCRVQHQIRVQQMVLNGESVNFQLVSLVLAVRREPLTVGQFESNGDSMSATFVR